MTQRPLFTRELVQAISDWQRKPRDRTHRHKKAVALMQACSHLPNEFRQTSLTCYRQMALDKGSVWKLLGEQELDEQVSSWTLDMEVAKTLLGGVPDIDVGMHHVIFVVHPRPEQVVVNMSSLLRAPEFQQAVLLSKPEIAYFEQGLGKYANDQAEVVLNVGELNEADIWSLGGRSSSFKELVASAFAVLHGRAPGSEAEFNAFFDSVKEMEGRAGARWMEHESTKNVLRRLRPRTEVLQEIASARQARLQQAKAAVLGK